MVFRVNGIPSRSTSRGNEGSGVWGRQRTDLGNQGKVVNGLPRRSFLTPRNDSEYVAVELLQQHIVNESGRTDTCGD